MGASWAQGGPARRLSQGLGGRGRREAVGGSRVGAAWGRRTPGGARPLCTSRSTSAKEAAAGTGWAESKEGSLQ